MKKTLIALAIMSCASVTFAQTCNGDLACSPPTNSTTVEDNRNGQIATGGSIANGANVQAYGGTGGSVVGGSAATTSGAATTTSGAALTTGGTIGAQTLANTNAGINGQSNASTGAISVAVTTTSVNDLAIAKEAAAAQVEAARILSDVKVRNTPNVGAAVLTSSNDTCMGSFGGGASGPGFGVQIGSTYKDTNCVMLKNSREMWNMGYRAAALALMCTDAANKEALELTGEVCPQTKRDAKLQATSVVGYSGNDPIVRARLAN